MSPSHPSPPQVRGSFLGTIFLTSGSRIVLTSIRDFWECVQTGSGRRQELSHSLEMGGQCSCHLADHSFPSMVWMGLPDNFFLTLCLPRRARPRPISKSPHSSPTQATVGSYLVFLTPPRPFLFGASFVYVIVSTTLAFRCCL